MPRRARVRHAGVPQHVIQRGNNRAACFFADEDYLTYLEPKGSASNIFLRNNHAPSPTH